MRAHPRVCGENVYRNGIYSNRKGSSPRVRGKRGRAEILVRENGLIPACAGKTLGSSFNRLLPRAHPRVCGENPWFCRGVSSRWGSSPRVRGKQGTCWFILTATGLIPACAGKTYLALRGYGQHRAHPRVCGENAGWPAARVPEWGSSPRVRGKLFGSKWLV